NGGQEEWPEVIRMDLTRNGDWTFQIKVMLVTKPQRGDIYVCQVEHASFASPARVQWEPQTDSGQSKMWTGVAGIILGLVFLAPGLLLYLKNRKGNVLPQSPAALMS
ncbi:DLA class II histocompatibility antigen, DR-1 beta chain-like, partial [Sceloporus undulatus]|uniref:DLA class II histocompatibility antigen, DR-1 beta chain-like n=1 Tax=Sceloporus undulatus TaxID=8520 RepID=UPI001C4BD9A5